MNASHNSNVFLLLFIAIIGILSLEVNARRRDPLSELREAEGGNRRRLTQQQQQQQQQQDHPGLLTKDSVRGSRSLVGKNVEVPVPSGPGDHLVTNLPLLNKNEFPGDHWAGLLPVNGKKDGYLFYWLFAPDKDALSEAKRKGIVNEDESNVPLLIWLNGGPACSSMDGLWIENGPFRLNPNRNGDWNDIRIDPNSWHKAPAFTLYIDQPVGTGLAFTTSGNYPNNDERVNEDFYYFLNEFMRLHRDTLGVVRQKHDSDHQKLWTLQRPFFFSGESHAGHYIPSMMNYIRKKNMDLEEIQKQNNVVMPLTGAAIGNGWFDPIYQYSAHGAAYGYSLIGKAQERALAKREEICREDLKKKMYTSNVCFELLADVTHNSLGENNPQIVSQYDARVFESRKGSRDFPPGHRDVEAYLGQTKKIPNANVHDVLEAVHATPSWDSGQRYLECTNPPYYALADQDGLGVVPDIVELLEHEEATSGPEGAQTKIHMLFFNGIHDLICNHVGNENALENLPWKHKDEYIKSERYGWTVSSTNTVGGYAKEFENLTFLKVLDAGHMVPMDVPEVALDMMVTFLYSKSSASNNNKRHGGPFKTYPQGLDMSLEDRDPSCPACPTCPSSISSSKHEECPICNDTQDESAKCPDKCDSEEFQAKTLSSPLVKGVIAGFIAFVVLLLFAWCFQTLCFARSTTSSSGIYQKAGQIEMSGGNGTGGYRDQELNGEYGQDSFEDEEE